jgi:hypothetical protein
VLPYLPSFVDLGSGEGWPSILAAALLPLRAGGSRGVEIVPRLVRRAEAHRTLVAAALAAAEAAGAGAADDAQAAGGAARQVPPASAGAVDCASGGAVDGAALLRVLRRAAHPGAPAALDGGGAGAAAAAAVTAVRFELGSFLEDSAGSGAGTSAGAASASASAPAAPPPAPPWHEADIVFVNATAFDEKLLHGLHLRSERMRPGALLVLTTQRSPSKLFELVHEGALEASWGAPVTVRVYRRKRLGAWVGGVLGRPRR